MNNDRILISVTYETHLTNESDYIKEGILNKDSCGGPNTFYIHKELNYSYIPDYCTMVYSEEKYLYMFLFYNFDEDSIIKDIFNKYFNSNDNINRYDDNQIAVLSNKIIDEYIYKDENLIVDGEPSWGSDQVGGNLICAIL